MRRKKLTMAFFCLIVSAICNGQLKKDFVQINKLSDPSIYKVSIYNNSDSVLCFLTCGFISSSEYRNDTVITLVPFRKDKSNKYHYSAQFTSANNDISLEIPFYSGIAILPYQEKEFVFTTEKGNTGIFEIEYLYISNYVHESFKKESVTPHWFKKYKIHNDEITF